MTVEEVISILICPRCSSKLTAGKGYLECPRCGARYSIIDGRIVDFIGTEQGWIVFFERYPELYDPWSRIGWRLSGKGSLDSFYEKLIEGLDSGLLVDAGCGTGSLIAALEKRGYEGTPIGIDISLPMLRVAARKTKKAVFLRCSIERIPIIDGSIDHYISSLVLHILKDKKRAVNEISRILRNGGSVRIAVAVTDSFRGKVFNRLLGVYAIRSSEYMDLLRSMGIEILRTVDYGAFKALYGAKKTQRIGQE